MSENNGNSLGKNRISGGTAAAVICVWGGAEEKDNPQLPLSQSVAALTILFPALVAYTSLKQVDCAITPLNAGPACLTPICFAAIVPGSVSNHLGCAVARHWVTPLQKWDRIGIMLSSVLASWSCSQNLAFAASSAVLTAVVLLAMFVGPEHIRQNCDLVTMAVGAIVMYAQLAMFRLHEDWDPNAVSAVICMCSGFIVFRLAPFGVWTDAVWHLQLTIYAYFNSQYAIALEHRLYGGCPGAAL
eukprot:gnl/TRDRNA2_/TRDRNA2_93990_c0_seq1.p1 gnl/TRDRNA2_/TRDRNA2_93990_c0~~gnl/TRDRNA2_/TRDRNA2_93990_c0_seq1.p1  ORF type:complete len:280 (-),score=33.46 gnl/TRDRNA2_/TRDRNA2_93990_c0_seq1:123-854(-)